MTENEAIHLINLLKEILNNKKVYIPLNGEKSNTIVVDIKDQIPFNIIIYRGRREKTKCQYQLLLSQGKHY